MRRAVIVIGTTVVGLVAVLSFHTVPAKLTLGSLSAGTASRSTTTTTPAGASPPTTGSAPPSPTTAVPTTVAPASTSFTTLASKRGVMVCASGSPSRR